MLIFIISFVFVMGIVITYAEILVHTSLHKNKDVELAISQIQSMLLIMLPLAVFSIILALFTINSLICALGWILIIWFCKKSNLSKLSILTPVDTRVAMTFLAMLLCTIYFAVFWVVDYKEGFSSHYFSMLCIILSVMLGFFVPINILLSDNTFTDFIRSIKEETKISTLRKPTWITFGITISMFIIHAIVSNIDFIKKETPWLSLGFISGIIISIPIMSIIIRNHRDSIKDCCDTRQFIFKEENFKTYQKRVEEFLKYTNKERYDHIEAVLFYKAYTEILTEQMAYEADSSKEVCKHFKKDYKWCNEMSIVKRRNDNENIYVLQKGRNRYCGDVMTSPWPLVKEYLRAYSGLEFENGNVPIKDRERYERAGFKRNKEKWLLYFLEQYHKLSDKDKEMVVPKELKSYLCYAYKENAIWIIPIGCNTGKMIYAGGASGRRELYDFGDLVLLAIYKWYHSKNEGTQKAREGFESLFGKGKNVVDIWEKWLLEFEDWNDFVVSNNLQKMVNQEKTISKMNYVEPIMFFQNHSSEKLLPETKDEWLEMFKKMSEVLFNRY